MSDFFEKLKKSTLIADGAMGTMLFSKCIHPEI
jgi:methionine synthase I (cobalamin-dependent)